MHAAEGPVSFILVTHYDTCKPCIDAAGWRGISVNYG
jgi:hypothetical protein